MTKIKKRLKLTQLPARKLLRAIFPKQVVKAVEKELQTSRS
jgi:hypothetical protein